MLDTTEANFDSRTKVDSETIERKLLVHETNEEHSSSAKLDIYHTPEGKMRTRLKNGDHVAVSYVDTGALIATHESRITDAEIEQSSAVSELFNDDQIEEGKEVAEEQVEESKKEGTFANVFARAFRRITTELGRESIVSLKSVPDIRVEQGNAKAINASIDSGLAFVIPEEQEEAIIAIFREESKAFLADSDERTVDNLFTGHARVMGNGMGIPIRANDKNPTYMYFMYGKTKETPLDQETNIFEVDTQDEGEEIK